MVLLSTAGLVMAAAGAVAAPIAGCSQATLDAMSSRSQAEVAYNVTARDQLIDKPDSVLAMACFDQYSGVSANSGGAIFSDDFTSKLSPVVQPSLSEFYNNSFADAAGKDNAGWVDYSGATLSTSTNCTGMNKLWDNLEKDGTDRGAPYAAFDDLVKGDSQKPLGVGPVALGTDMSKSWDAAQGQGVFGQLDANSNALPRPSDTDYAVQGTQSSCAVLVAAGMSVPCP